MNQTSTIQAAIAGILALGLVASAARATGPPSRRTRKSATASPRPGRTIAAPRSTPARARAPRPTTTRPNGSTSPRARATRWAARRSPPRCNDRAGIRFVSRPGAMPSGRASHMTPLRRPIAGAGIGLRAPHVRADAGRAAARCRGSKSTARTITSTAARRSRRSMRIRADYPLSLHGVGMSLGSTDPLDRVHLAKLAAPDRAHRARARLRAPLLERRRRSRAQRPAAAAVHRGSARARLRARRRGAGFPRPRAPGRERLDLPRVRRLDDSRMGIRRRRRAPHRLQAPAATSTTSTSTR